VHNQKKRGYPLPSGIPADGVKGIVYRVIC